MLLNSMSDFFLFGVLSIAILSGFALNSVNKKIKKEQKNNFNFERTFWRSIAMGTTGFVLIHFLGFTMQTSSGISMLPTMPIKNFAVVYHHAYQIRLPFNIKIGKTKMPSLGDVVVSEVYDEELQELLPLTKRVLGTEGDTVKYEEGIFYINGKSIINEKDFNSLFEDRVTQEVKIWNGEKEKIFKIVKHKEDHRKGIWQIPEGHVFLVGDNWRDSYDSRNFGPVKISDIKGQVFFSYSSERGIIYLK